MGLSIESIETLLLVASIVAVAARRIRIPYTVGFVIAGILLTFLPLNPDIGLTKEQIYTIFLPPLIFEAALYIRWSELRKDLPVILTLATVGVLLAAAVTAVGMHVLANWEWASAILFGVLIAATDPVSVIATFKEAGVTGRLRLLVEAESLFNDSTAAIAFTVAIAFASGAPVSVASATGTAIALIAGGVVCGAIVAGAMLILAGRTRDHLVEISLTTVAAYGSFLFAEHFHVSGVLASLVAGLLIGNAGSLGAISAKGRESVESFWEYAAFVVNSLIFILIGVREAHQNFSLLLGPIAIAILLVIGGRAIAVYPLSALFSRSSLRVKSGHQHVLFWGGLRGALALALALGLPEGIPQREDIVTVAFGVVTFSIFAQGLTMTPLLRRIKEIAAQGPKEERPDAN